MEITPSSTVLMMPELAFSFAIAWYSRLLVRSSGMLAFAIWLSLPTSASRETTPLSQVVAVGRPTQSTSSSTPRAVILTIVWISLVCHLLGVGGGTLLLLSHLLSKVSGTSIQPLAGPMALISSRSASPLSGPYVTQLRRCSPVFPNAISSVI